MKHELPQILHKVICISLLFLFFAGISFVVASAGDKTKIENGGIKLLRGKTFSEFNPAVAQDTLQIIADSSYRVGDTSSFAILLHNIKRVNGLNFIITYDSAVIHPTDVIPMGRASLMSTAAGYKFADNKISFVVYDNQARNLLPDSSKIFIVKFVPSNSVGGGTIETDITFYQGLVADSNLTAIPFDYVNGRLSIRPLPIQLASFTGQVVPGRGVLLKWTTVSEINNYGFYVQRRTSVDSTFSDLHNVFIPGHGTTNEPHHYEFLDSTVTGPVYHYRLRQVDLDGTQSFSPAIVVNLLTSVQENLPIEFALFQNYPNPFNPVTTVRYDIPTPSRVNLKVYNIIGQVVKTLIDEVQEPGYKRINWNSDNNFGNQVASGVYFYRIEAASITEAGRSFTNVKKMIVLK